MKTSYVSQQEAAAELLRRRGVLLPYRETAMERLLQSKTAVLEITGLDLDAWQKSVLESESTRLLLLCSRQAGKSTVSAALAIRTAILEDESLILLLSPTLRQSGELFRDKVLRLYDRLGRPLSPVRETALSLELSNGSRIISLPENEAGIRGYSGVNLLVIDEASRVQDSLYYAVRPMLAVSRGRLLALTTPFGKRGWFYREWSEGEAWERVRVTANQCPRIPPEFLAGEQKSLGVRWYRQEYECSFEDTVDQVFSQSDIDAALVDDIAPLDIL